MSDFVVSLIRTNVPVVVGAIVGWLISLGITVEPEAEQALTAALVLACSAAYYAGARWLERRWPGLGVLLGKKAEPSYTKPPGPIDTDGYIGDHQRDA